MSALLVLLICVALGLCIGLPIISLLRSVDRTNPRKRLPRNWRSA